MSSNENAAEAAPLEGEIVNEHVQPTAFQIAKAVDNFELMQQERHNNIVAKSAKEVQQQYRIVRFKGELMVEVDEPYSHFKRLGKEYFDQLAYPILGGVTRSRMNDVYSYLRSTAEDLTEYQHYILFGLTVAEGLLHPEFNSCDAEFNSKNRQAIWDAESLTWAYGEDSEKAVWRSPYPQLRQAEGTEYQPVEFVMQLAGGDQDLYDDIMQSIAPIIMRKKPDGVVWWVGSGANGKSTLMDALYKIFPNQFTSLTVRRLMDGRDTPSLNGALANIVKESSEGRVEDTETYKALGTHENFGTHKFHSQENLMIDANLHTIFSANSIPTFNDKGYSARRRTFIVPFTQQFESDPTFEERTFTAEFFAQLVSEMTRYAVRLKNQGYKYKWSAKTRAAKMEYDSEANNAEEYAEHLIRQGVVAFDSFTPVKIDYENWCADMGYPPLGIHNLRKAMTALGFERTTRRAGSSVENFYRLRDIDGNDPLERLNLGRPGLFVRVGFRPEHTAGESLVKQEKPRQTSILNNKW